MITTGTFIIRPTGQDSLSGTGFSLGGGASNSVQAVHDIDSFFIEMLAINSNKSGQIRYNFTGASIYLDGSSTPISFQSLPSGWTPLTATLVVDGAPGGNTDINSTAGSPSVTTTISNVYLQFDSLTEKLFTVSASYGGSGNPVNNDIPQPYNFIFPYALSAINLINNGCGIRWNLIASGANNIAITGIDRLYIQGTYQILAFQFQLSSSSNPSSNRVFKGTKITISSASGGLTHLLKTGPYSGVSISWIDSSGVLHTYNVLQADIIEETDFIIIFYLFINVIFTDLPSNGTNITIGVTGDGTQFSGSIAVGSPFVFIADGSGIYVITPNKRNDTLYQHIDSSYVDTYGFFELEDEILDTNVINPNAFGLQGLFEDDPIYNDIATVPLTNSISIGATMDVSIPDPFIKTGFLGS